MPSEMYLQVIKHLGQKDLASMNRVSRATAQMGRGLLFRRAFQEDNGEVLLWVVSRGFARWIERERKAGHGAVRRAEQSVIRFIETALENGLRPEADSSKDKAIKSKDSQDEPEQVEQPTRAAKAAALFRRFEHPYGYATILHVAAAQPKAENILTWLLQQEGADVHAPARRLDHCLYVRENYTKDFYLLFPPVAKQRFLIQEPFDEFTGSMPMILRGEFFPLSLACAFHQRDNVLALLEAGASPKLASWSVDGQDYMLTALHMAAHTKDHMGVAKNIILRYRDYRDCILPGKAGAALHIAAKTRNIKTLAQILDNACDINVLTANGELAHVGVMENMIATLDPRELSQYYNILKAFQTERHRHNLAYPLEDDPLSAVSVYLQEFHKSLSSREKLSDTRFLDKVVLFYLEHPFTPHRLFDTDMFNNIVHELVDILLLKPDDKSLRKTCGHVLDLDNKLRSSTRLRLESDEDEVSLVKKLVFSLSPPEKPICRALSSHHVKLHRRELRECFPKWLFDNTKTTRVWYDMRQFRHEIQSIPGLTDYMWDRAFTERREDVVKELRNG